jgi:hypothetical protein
MFVKAGATSTIKMATLPRTTMSSSNVNADHGLLTTDH